METFFFITYEYLSIVNAEYLFVYLEARADLPSIILILFTLKYKKRHFRALGQKENGFERVQVMLCVPYVGR